MICTITLFDDDGWCRLSPKQLGVGTHDLVASYGGNSMYLASAGTAKLTVAQRLTILKAGKGGKTTKTRATVTTLKLSAATVAYGSEQLVRLSVLTLSPTAARARRPAS